MLTKRYVYKSNVLKERYLDNQIDYDTYIASLETLRNEELDSHSYGYGYPSQSSIDAEVWSFELQQWESIQQERRIRESEERRVEKEREEEEREKALTPEQKLYRERERYYRSEIPRLIDSYKKDALKYKRISDRWQWIIIVGSALVTSVTGVTIFSGASIIFYFKLVAAGVSILVSVAAGFTAYFKYRERSMNLQKAADDIELEYEAVKLGTGLYYDKPREEAVGDFADRVLKRIREQREQQQILEQPHDTKQARSNA